MKATTKFVHQYWPNMYVNKDNGELLRVYTTNCCRCRQDALNTIKEWEEFYAPPKYTPIMSWIDVYDGAKRIRLICKEEYHYARPVMY